MAADDADAYSLEGPGREVEAGLPNERGRLGDAQANYDFYCGDNERYIESRQAEDAADFASRPKRTLDFTRQVVGALCRDLYQPPPARTLEGAPGLDEWLRGVYRDNHADSRWHKADVLSTLSWACAIQVAATGDPARPLKWLLWGAEELAAWADPDDPTTPVAVCTIDRHDEQTRYRLWDAVTVRTYRTKKLAPGQTAGGRVAELVDAEPHGYGVLPFAWVTHELPDRCLWGSAPGNSARRANATIDRRLSDLADAIDKYHAPIPYAIDVAPGWRPVVRPGSWVHIPRQSYGPTDEGAAPPQLGFLKADLDIAGAWQDVEQYALQKAESLEVPRAAIRMEQTGVSSGIALVAEQAPLLQRAKNRRATFAVHETGLARVCLAVAGNHYGRPELVAAAADVRLTLQWPEPRIPIPGPERDEADKAEIDLGIASPITVAMERYGMDRAQAEAHVRLVAKDNDLMASLLPPPVDPLDTLPGQGPPSGAPGPGAEGEGAARG